MHGKIALDSDVAIKFLNGDKAIDGFLSQYSEIYLPVIVVGELIFGALNSNSFFICRPDLYCDLRTHLCTECASCAPVFMLRGCCKITHFIELPFHYYHSLRA